MLSLQERLQQVPWATLSHAYGPATDTPIWLVALLSDEAEQRDEAFARLDASICHQGSVYEASCAAIPFLIEILELAPVERKSEILSFLSRLAHVCWYADRDQRFLTMQRSLDQPPLQHWTSTGEFIMQGNEYHEAEWMQLAHQLVGDGMEAYLALLHAENVEVVRETLFLLSGFREKNTLLIPYVSPLAFEADISAIQTAALGSLAALLDAGAPEWERYYRLACSDSSSISDELRFVAASCLAQYYPQGSSEEAVRPLVEALVRNYSLKEACRAFSSLGSPLGLQGLLRAFEYGSMNWHILDTVRVAEVLMDVVFFGGWVRGRFWGRQEDFPSSWLKVIPGLSHLFDQASTEDTDFGREGGGDTNNDDEEAHFYWDHSTYWQGSAFAGERYQVTCSGYDEREATRLRLLFEREGGRALSAAQVQAIRALLRCESFWQKTNNLPAIYGLPVTKAELEQMLEPLEEKLDARSDAKN